MVRYGVLGRIRENGNLGSLLPSHLQQLFQYTLKCLLLNLTAYQLYPADLVQIFSAGLEICPVLSEWKTFCKMLSSRKRYLSLSSL
jgi:hypothetical protein